MERTAKVSFDFIVFTPTDKGVFGDNIIAEMTEHSSVFPTPDIAISDLDKANSELKLKTQQALSGDKVKIQERDAAEPGGFSLQGRQEDRRLVRLAQGDRGALRRRG